MFLNVSYHKVISCCTELTAEYGYSSLNATANHGYSTVRSNNSKKNLFIEYEIHLNNGCIDLRENCTFYATTYDEYCNYNEEFMKIYCPFSCGFCGMGLYIYIYI